MNQRKHAFTIAELLIVIVVIAILATIGIASYTIYQKHARDTRRESSAQAIAEALEKYYEQNGEYPGCGALTSGNAASILGSIDTSILKAPKDSADAANSITCQALDSLPQGDKFFYSGDTSAGCQTGPACAKWVLTWRKERGGTGELKSRRSESLAVTTPVITATAAGPAQINTSWTAVANAVSYNIQYSTSASFASFTTRNSASLSTSFTGLTPDTTYYFRVQAVQPGTTSGWSAVAQAKTAAITAPSVSISAVMSGSNAVGTASSGTCSSGTLELEIRSRTGGGTWTTYTAGNPRSIAATPGTAYEFQARTRCVIGATQSAYTESSTASVTAPVPVPTGLTLSAVMSGANAVGTAGGTCASGTTIEYQIRYNASATSTAGTWSNYSSGSSLSVPALEGHKYIFEQQARCVGPSGGASAWVTSSQASVVRSIATPAVPTVTNNGAGSGGITTWTRSAVTCPTGTTAQYQDWWRSDSGYDYTDWKDTIKSSDAWNTSSQGYEYSAWYRARCTTAHASSDWATSAKSSYIRPVAAPGSIAWSGGFEGQATLRIIATSSCGPGATLYVQTDTYSESWPWASSGKTGWASASYPGTLDWFYSDSSTQMGTISNSGYIPSGKRFYGGINIQCKNYQTGRASATTGWQYSHWYVKT